MIRMNRIQADLSDPFFGIEGEGHETDDVVVDQGNMDLLWRLRLAQARQMLGLLGIGRSQCEGGYRLTDNVPEGSEYGLEGCRTYPLDRLQIGGFESSDSNVRRHGCG